MRVGTLRKTHGFTLIELLVALSVTAVVGVLSWQFIDSAIRVNEEHDTQLADVMAMEQFWQIIDMDLQHSILRPVPGDGPDNPVSAASPPAFSGGGQSVSANLPVMLADAPAGVPLMQLLREGWVHPAQQARSGLQRVLYSLEDDALVRRSWPERNLGEDLSGTTRRVLLEGIESVSLRFLPRDAVSLEQDWRDRWPDPQYIDGQAGQAEADPLLAARPRAVLFSVRTRELGDVERLYTLPGG